MEFIQGAPSLLNDLKRFGQSAECGYTFVGQRGWPLAGNRPAGTFRTAIPLWQRTHARPAGSRSIGGCRRQIRTVVHRSAHCLLRTQLADLHAISQTRRRGTR